jgi:hypothetical protein
MAKYIVTLQIEVTGNSEAEAIDAANFQTAMRATATGVKRVKAQPKLIIPYRSK